MTLYYKKLDLDIDHSVFNIDKLKGYKLFEYGNNIGYFNIPDKSFVNDIFKHAFRIPPVHTWLVQAKSELNPHVDNGCLSCLNYYIKPRGLVTNFWKPVENAKKQKEFRQNAVTKQYEAVELSYLKKDLILEDTFIATDNSTYILNIGEIHSVERQPGNIEYLDGPRTMIQFQWDMTMEEMIEKLGF